MGWMEKFPKSSGPPCAQVHKEENSIHPHNFPAFLQNLEYLSHERGKNVGDGVGENFSQILRVPPVRRFTKRKIPFHPPKSHIQAKILNISLIFLENL